MSAVNAALVGEIEEGVERRAVDGVAENRAEIVRVGIGRGAGGIEDRGEGGGRFEFQGCVHDAGGNRHAAFEIGERIGGGAVGLSLTMAPWGGVLTDEEIQLLVKKIRAFKK